MASEILINSCLLCPSAVICRGWGPDSNERWPPSAGELLQGGGQAGHGGVLRRGGVKAVGAPVQRIEAVAAAPSPGGDQGLWAWGYEVGTLQAKE